MLQLLHFTEKTPVTYLLENWMGRRAAPDGTENKKKYLFLLPVKTRFLHRPNPSLVTIPTELSQFQLTHQ
jgi:hypothetical protein